MFFRILSASLIAAALASAMPVAAQSERSILVLDASGSMWGQIGGEAKITIAQRVIGGLLDAFPEDQELGLTVYGHRRKGDCSDIELLVPAGPGTKETIRQAISAIKPKGKTPLSAAVVAAAGALKFEEDAATVILISDGRETCDLDPCEVGRTLEETGVSFTAHVIGFDVTDADDRAQLQCLAENTGGRFLTASDADELSAALEEVSIAPPPPPPAKLDMLFRAIDGEGGPVIRSGLTWTLTDTGSGQAVLSDFDVADIRMALPAGGYSVEVRRTSDGETASLDVRVAGDGPREAVLVLASSVPDAMVDGPATAVAGSTVAVTWAGPEADNDFISVALPDQKGGSYASYTYAREGSPLKLVMPPEAGSYELRYVQNDGRKVLARAAVEITPAQAAIDAPDSAVAGSTITVGWSGPDYANDFISVAGIEAKGGSYVNYTYTREGAPLKLVMPVEPGEYEIRYVMNQARTVIARKPVSVTSTSAMLSAPEEAAAGSTIAVDWSGPDYANDFISVAIPDSKGGQYVNYAYAREGSPLKLVMPPEPGSYEIRYVLNQGRRVLAVRIVSVIEAPVTLDAPDAAGIGASVVVAWAGPDEPNDFISVAGPDQKGGQYFNYTYTREGSPLKLVMPPEPGSYEIRYILNQDRRIMGRRIIEVAAVAAAVQGPQSAIAGETVTVGWTGPDYANDFISVAGLDQAGNQYVNYTYTRDGNPLKLLMPAEPGSYEIRYILNQDRQVLASMSVEVSPAVAKVDAPAEAAAGSTAVITWEGPDYANDYIAVALPDQKGGQYTAYTYTREGSPLKLVMPPEPGSYEIRYVMNQGRIVLNASSIEITDVSAVLDAPGSAGAGGVLKVDWVGPDYPGDYVSIAEAGSKDTAYKTYAYTRDGTPALVKLPDAPGEYEIRYVMKTGKRVIERAPLRVD